MYIRRSNLFKTKSPHNPRTSDVSLPTPTPCIRFFFRGVEAKMIMNIEKLLMKREFYQEAIKTLSRFIDMKKKIIYIIKI